MSLNWSVENVKDWKRKSRSDSGHKLRDTLVWATLAIGINNITEKNYKKFYTRLHTYECIADPYRTKFLKSGKIKKIYVTLEEVKNWVGLHTNANSYSSKEFEDRLLRFVDSHEDMIIRSEQKSKKVKA